MFGVIHADTAPWNPNRMTEFLLGHFIAPSPDVPRPYDAVFKPARRGNTVFLKGNHEAFLADVFRDPSRIADWAQVGGLQTLMSYGLSPSPNPDEEEQRVLVRELAEAMPPQHLEVLKRLRLTFTCGDFLFVHAGI